MVCVLIKKFQPVLLISVILGVLLYSVSCGTTPTPTLVPVTQTFTIVPTQTPTPTLAPTRTPSPQPTQAVQFSPALVEVQPLPNSELALQESLTLYFNQPMQRASVEKAWQSKPLVNGHIEWQDDATAKYVLDEPLPPTTIITFTLDTTAQAANGKSLTQPVELTYHSADYLRVSEKLPKAGASDVDVNSVIAVLFNQPVVTIAPGSSATGSGSAGDLPAAFTLEPITDGRGEWINASTYAFYPTASLLGGTQYTVNLNTSLIGVKTVPLSPNYQGLDKSWSFITVSPALVSVTPAAEGLLPVDASFTLTFNQPMDAASVEQNFSLQEVRGNKVTGSFAWNVTKSEVTFKPASMLKRGAMYNLVLLGVASSAVNNLPLKTNLAVQYTTVPAPDLVDAGPGTVDLSYNGYGSIPLKFNVPLKDQDFTSLIGINPDVDDFKVTLSEDKQTLTLAGFFKQNGLYYVGISPDLVDRWEQNLGKEIYRSYKTAIAPASLVISALQSGKPVLFVPPEDISLPVVSTNISKLDISYSQLEQAQFIQLAEASNEERMTYPQTALDSWQQDIAYLRDRHTRLEVPLTRNRKRMTTGFYYYMITAPELQAQGISPQIPFLMVLSNVNVVLKVSADQALVWAVSIDKNKPVAGAPVVIYDNKGNTLGGCSTDTQGLCLVNLPTRTDANSTLYAVIWKPGHDYFGVGISSWSRGITAQSFNQSARLASDHPIAYLYTDRPVYRTGQTVYFRAVVRQSTASGYSMAAFSQITIKVLGAPAADTGQAPVLTVYPLPLSVYGTVSGSYTISPDAPPGIYSLAVQEIDGAVLTFQVAKYQKSDIELQAQFMKSGWVAGEDIEAQVKAVYQFDVPVSHLAIKWTLYSAAGQFPLTNGFIGGKQDMASFNSVSLSENGGSGTVIAAGSGETDQNGSLDIKVMAADILAKVDKETVQDLTLVAEVDATQQEQAGEAQAQSQMHPANFYIGVHPESWGTQAGSEVGFTIQTVDWQKNPSGNHDLKASFQKELWKVEEVKDQKDNTWLRPVADFSQVGSSDFSTDANGQARLVFVPPDPGTYLLEIRGEGTVTQVRIWVGGDGAAVWPSLSNQHLFLTADAQEYQAGQIARIFVPSPFKDETQALITVEGSHITQYKALFFSASSYVFTLPITEEDVPDVYVSVTLLGRQADDVPDFRQGYIHLKILPARQTLQVDLAAQPLSGQESKETHFKIQVRDSEGKPVKGEFSLAIVNKVDLALTRPNASSIQATFYGTRPLGVYGSLSLAAYGRRLPGEPVVAQSPGNGVAQSGMNLMLAAPSEDTVFWYGNIELDINGMAEFNLTLPDGLSKTWVVTVRGLTQDTLVGEAELEIGRMKELAIDTSIPRYLTIGDHAELAVDIYNNGTDDLDVNVSLQATGLTLDQSTPAEQKVTVPKGKQVRVTWWGSPQPVAQVSLTFSAVSGQLQDSTQSSLPVFYYQSLQGFPLSGVLDKAGEQLDAISLPHSFTPDGGDMYLDMAPSLASVLVSGADTLENAPLDLNEAILSRLLANLEVNEALQKSGLTSSAIKDRLSQISQDSISRLSRNQNGDGGWGWAAGYPSDNYQSAYILLGLLQAASAGDQIDINVLKKAQGYLTSTLVAPEVATPAWQLDRLALQYYVLQQSGRSDIAAAKLFEQRKLLSPWAKALLALTLEAMKPGSDQARTLLTDLEGTAQKSTTGVFWQDESFVYQNLETVNFTTAVVSLALARLDAQSPLLPEAVRYLVSHRQAVILSQGPEMGWSSSFETTWVLMALSEVVKTKGNLQTGFGWSASLNGTSLLSGQAGGEVTLTPLQTILALDKLKSPMNELRLARDEGEGQLYYSAVVQAWQQTSTIPAVDQGIMINRNFYDTEKDCRANACIPVESVQLGEVNKPLLVRLTLSVTSDVYNLVVEDYIPAGMELLRVEGNNALGKAGAGLPFYDTADPFSMGWGWWYFGAPQVSGNHIRWVTDHLSPGTYELVYLVVPIHAGSYQLLPARAYQYYFQDVAGYSAGGVFEIKPTGSTSQ